MGYDEVVLSVECLEPEGAVVRHVRLCRLSFEKLRELYGRLSQFETLFNDEFAATPENFINTFLGIDARGDITMRGLIWEVDDVGILYITNIIPGFQAQAHFTFWDGRIRGRERLVLETTRYVFKELALHRLYCIVPMYARPILAAVERLGFTKEGRMREVIPWKGEWWDAVLYSLLDWEVKDGIRSPGEANPEHVTGLTIGQRRAPDASRATLRGSVRDRRRASSA